MKTACTLLALLFLACGAVRAQVVPAATGPGGPPITGNLHYAFRYSQIAEFGSDMDTFQTSTPSLSLDYANEKKGHPFNLNYSGGYTWTLSGPDYSSGLFQRMLLSQAMFWRKWNVRISDDVSYRPQAPTTGFSGIPGIGEPIGSPYPPSGQSILTLNSRVVENTATSEIQRNLDYGSFLGFGGGSDLLRYPDGSGLDTNTWMANAGLTWRLNARNSISPDYRFSQFSYPLYGFSFTTNSALMGFKRSWNKKITSDVSAGPEFTSSSDSTAVPSSIGLAVDSALTYQFRFVSASLTYNRQTNGGSGYYFGSQVDTINGSLSREFGRDLHVGIVASFARTAGLQNNGVTNSRYGGAQVSRRMGRYISAFANYTAMDQSSSAHLPANALNQLLHVVSFGMEYSPLEIHLNP